MHFLLNRHSLAKQPVVSQQMLVTLAAGKTAAVKEFQHLNR